MKTQVVKTFSDNSILASNSDGGTFSRNPSTEQYNEVGIDVGPVEVEGSVSVEESKTAKLCCMELKKRGRDLCRNRFQKKNWERTFPILKWSKEYTLQKLVSDFIAGMTVGLTILPQGLAYATIAGLPPIYGLYSGFVGPFVYILFGSTKVITIGPNAIQCILTYKFTQGKSPQYAVFLCFMTAIVDLTMAVLRLGFIANFISYPVISAFTSAVALTIVATQVRLLLGLPSVGEGFVAALKGLYLHFWDINKWDAIMSLICCTCILLLMKLQWIFKCFTKNSPRWDKFLWVISTSRNAIAITTCTILSASFTETNRPFTIVGPLEPGLPVFTPPPFSIYDNQTSILHTFNDLISEEFTTIFIMALLGVMGHITIAKAFAGSARVDASQEVLSIGIANLISSFFSSMPIAGSFSRTTVNAFSGAESPLGGLITGTMVLLALLFMTPYFYFIPLSSLASVVCASVIFMVDFRIWPMWRSKKPDLLPWSLTFFTTLFVGLEYGILTGLAVSAIFLLYYAARPRVKVLKGVTTLGSEFILVELDRSLTYPSVDYVTDSILKSANRWGDNTTPIVIDCHHIQFVDFTAAKALCDLAQDFKKTEYTCIFWKVKPSVLRVMEGIMDNSHTRFVHCRAEYEMEALVDSARLKTATLEEQE